MKSINHQAPNKEIWQKIKSMKGRPYMPIPTLHESGQIYNDESDIANILGQSFAENSSSENYNKEFQSYKNSHDK